jgi:hypothetical protein
MTRMYAPEAGVSGRSIRTRTEASRRTNRPSEAFHVREALRRYLGEQPLDERDPLEGLIGLVDDPRSPDDVAENDDHYLYGAPKERCRTS